MNEGVSYAVTRALADHLGSSITELVNIFEDFPEPNEVLEYPSLSIVTPAPDLRNEAPYIYSSDAASGTSMTSRYVTGEYEWPIIQVDLWAGSKMERHKLLEKIVDAFSSQFPVMGLSLTLADYHNVMCRYDMIGYDFPDGEEQSQRREFRAVVKVIAHCKRVVEREESIIISGEIGFQTGPTDGSHPDGYDLPVETNEVI